MLANGVFSYTVLPEDERMKARDYVKVIGKHFGPWLKSAFWGGANVSSGLRVACLDETADWLAMRLSRVADLCLLNLPYAPHERRD